MIRADITDKFYRAESEVEFVQFLYWLRGRSMPPEIENAIANNKFVSRSPLEDLRAAWTRADEQMKMALLQGRYIEVEKR